MAERIQGSSPVTSLAFSRDGSTLAIGRDDGNMSVLSLRTRNVSEIRNAHASSVEALRFGFGGRWIASLSLDAVEFWDSGDLSKIGTLIFPVVDGNLSWLFVNPQGLFEGESRALGSMLWRFSPRLDDVGPVELFEHDYFCQGLMKEVLLGKSDPGRGACKPPALNSRNRNLPVLTVSIDIKDKSQPVKSPRVKVDIHIQRAVVGGRPEAVKDVRLFRGGLLVKHWHGVIPESTQDLSTEVPITPGLNEFRAYGFNSDDVKSLDTTDGVLGDRSLARPGTTYILSVGVDDYAGGIPPLHYSGNDARAFVAALTGLQSGQAVRVATLVDGDATRDNILCGLRRLASDAQNPPSCASSELNTLQPTNIEDRVYIFFSGHGAPQTRGFALLPKDATYSNLAAPSGDKRLRNVISDSDLERELESILAAQQVLVLDACSAGSLITAVESANAPLNLNSFAQLAREKGIYILAAATARQAAMEGPAQGPGSNRSIMNYLLLEEGLIQKRAESKGPNGSLLIEDWFNYAVGHVPSAADQQPVSFLPMRQENTQTGILGYFKN
jgi:hypothetical protein